MRARKGRKMILLEKFKAASLVELAAAVLFVCGAALCVVLAVRLGVM